MTDARVCRMRHRLWLVVPNEGQPGMAFEAQLRDGQLVPAITVRDLSLSTALSGLLALTATAQLRFDGAPMAELPCALDGAASVICAPTKADAASLAEQMAKAKTVLVGFRAVGNLPLPVPDGPLVLDLDHTQEALDPVSPGWSRGRCRTVLTDRQPEGFGGPSAPPVGPTRDGRAIVSAEIALPRPVVGGGVAVQSEMD